MGYSFCHIIVNARCRLFTCIVLKCVDYKTARKVQISISPENHVNINNALYGI